MLIDKAKIEQVKRANELVAFIRSRAVASRSAASSLEVSVPFIMTTNRASWSMQRNNCGTVWRVTKAATCTVL